MSLARAWTRQLYGASGVALLVPATIACALAVLAFAGGFARLGSIGQALSGPAAPGLPAGSASGATANLHVALSALAPAVGSSGTGTGAAGSASSGLPASRAGVQHGGGNGGSRGGSGGGRSHGGHPGSRGQGGGNGGGGRPGSGGVGSPPSPAPTVVDRAVSLGTAVTAKVPGPVGSLATQTLKSVGAAVDRVLPLRLPPPNAPSAAAPTSPLLGLLHK